MDRTEQNGSGTRLRRFAPHAVVALGVLVALTSHGSVWAPPRQGGADPLVLLSVVAAASALGLLGTRLFERWVHRDRRATLGSVLPGSVVVAVLLSLFAISQLDLRMEAAASAEAVDREPGREGVRLESDWRGPATRRAGEDQAAGESLFMVSESVRLLRRLLLFVGLLCLVLAIGLRRSRARRAEVAAVEAMDELVRQAAHGAIVTSIDEMLADADPRTAIIGAYGRLQEELDGVGASRRDYEGPMEHLHRVLSGLRVRAAPLKTLIGLFEVARFSEHPLTSTHREQALDALRDVAADLTSPTGEPVTPGSG